MNAFNNLLVTAMSVIPHEILMYEKWLGNTINEIGLDIPQYAQPVEVEASIQYHIAEKTYTAYGLDLNKNYALINLPAEVVGRSEQQTPDRLTFHGKTWIVVKCNNWYMYDGWVKLIVVWEKQYEQGGINDNQN